MSGRVVPDEASVARRRAQLAAGLEHALRGGAPDVVLLGREAQAWYAPAGPRRGRGAARRAVAGRPHRGAGRRDVPARGRARVRRPARDRRTRSSRSRGTSRRRCGRAGSSRVRTIANIIDDRFRPAPRDPAFLRRVDVEPGAPVVAHVCGLLPGKRPADLVASAARVAARLPSVRYLVAGADEEPSATREAARRLGIDHVFRWLGEVDRQDMPGAAQRRRPDDPHLRARGRAADPARGRGVRAAGGGDRHPGHARAARRAALSRRRRGGAGRGDAGAAARSAATGRAAAAAAAAAPRTGFAEWVARHEAVLTEVAAVGAGVA